MSGKYSGRAVTKAREYWRFRLPLACFRCGRPVLATQRWTVEHVVERILGGHPTDPSNQWVSHARCNYSAGGKLGAARTNAKRPKTVERAESEKSRRIWGWP